MQNSILELLTINDEVQCRIQYWFESCHDMHTQHTQRRKFLFRTRFKLLSTFSVKACLSLLFSFRCRVDAKQKRIKTIAYYLKANYCRQGLNETRSNGDAERIVVMDTEIKQYH